MELGFQPSKIDSFIENRVQTLSQSSTSVTFTVPTNTIFRGVVSWYLSHNVATPIAGEFTLTKSANVVFRTGQTGANAGVSYQQNLGAQVNIELQAGTYSINNFGPIVVNVLGCAVCGTCYKL